MIQISIPLCLGYVPSALKHRYIYLHFYAVGNLPAPLSFLPLALENRTTEISRERDFRTG